MQHNVFFLPWMSFPSIENTMCSFGCPVPLRFHPPIMAAALPQCAKEPAEKEAKNDEENEGKANMHQNGPCTSVPIRTSRRPVHMGVTKPFYKSGVPPSYVFANGVPPSCVFANGLPPSHYLIFVPWAILFRYELVECPCLWNGVWLLWDWGRGSLILTPSCPNMLFYYIDSLIIKYSRAYLRLPYKPKVINNFRFCYILLSHFSVLIWCIFLPFKGSFYLF